MSRCDLGEISGAGRAGVAVPSYGALPVQGRVGAVVGPSDAGGGALARALDRWRRAVRPDRHTQVSAPGAASPADVEGVAALARRLDDGGCSYGRVSAAKLEQMIRAYDRLETKLNAVLMAMTGTFLSTLAGLLLYYVRGGGQ